MELGSSKEGKATDNRFRAFVSYSHADAKFARKLHRKIESYRLPAHFRSKPVEFPEIQSSGRLGKIFRDREDLPAAEDLSEAVKAALSKSQALIVICSPDARSSPWVAKEISLFRSLHPDRPILAAIVRGEPGQVFPGPLSVGNEPLAADLRKEGDGWRLGFLKIVAGIAGVSLDTLVQRDAQRRLRRVMAVTGGVFAGLLAMIGMTLFAIQSRNEAQLQRAEAEGLVEFMLTDLRAGLKGVGRLDVMTHVNERAMDYYEGQSNLADMPAASLERRARILHAMGEDDEKRGDLEKALAKFGEAHRVTRALLEMDPDNADRIFGHAQSEYWVGYLAYLKEDWGKAELHWIEYQSLAELLIGLDAGQSKWRRESGYSNGNICTLSLHRTDQSDVDVTSCAAALSDMQLVQNMLPNNKRAILDVANRYGWYGDALNRIGDKASSMKQYNFQHELLTELRKQKPDDFEIADELIRAKMSMTKGLHSLERIGDAADLKRESAALARHLIERDPDNRRWKILLSQIEKAEY